MPYTDRAVAVVTGGAGGLGSAICRKLADAGMCIVVGYNRSEKTARQLADSLPGRGHSARPALVTDSAALTTLARGIEQDHGRCDVLVNCAGTTRFVRHADLDALDDTLIDTILATNVRGAFAAVRAFRTMLEKSPLPSGGVVVNISSAAATLAMGSNVIYCASKAAMDNMTKSLARALAPRIRVISVSPGLVDTEFVKSMDPAWHDEQEARTPLGRLATPEEIGDAVAAAVHHMTSATGCVFLVDGGRSLA
ncbi:MAG TPA: SDR family oxidoreductase [Bryobacteraceae bacterium]|nr:SDR family oxidoreductase [Bryobacteraceae bacterium]